MREQFLQKIFNELEEHEMIGANDLVFAGVSGGADSMCLLAVLLAYQRRVDFELRVIHVEHGIRGAESVADAAYVKRFCEERGVPCEIVRVEAVGYAKEQGLSLEEAARTLRYGVFESRAAQVVEGRRVRLAVAHHREDQAETVLWQMIRGSDVRGLGGMHPKRGYMIRPLLCVGRADIEDFLHANGICWREDRTNACTDYTRNCIRREVLPVLSRLNTQAAAHIFETAERMRETEDFLREQTERLYERYVHCGPERVLLLEAALVDESPLLVRRVLYEALCVGLGSAKNIGAEHVRLLGALFSLQVGRVLHLPYGGRAKRVYGGVRLSAEAFVKGAHRKHSPETAGEGPFVKSRMEEQGDLCAGGCVENMRATAFLPEQVHMEVLTHVDLDEISKKKYTKWFDYDKIKDNVRIRRRESGDYLVIDGEGHRQKLSRYMVNEKIPQEERDQLLLVADGSHVMWVIGHRISDYYKVDENTTKVLKVQLSGGKEDE